MSRPTKESRSVGGKKPGFEKGKKRSKTREGETEKNIRDNRKGKKGVDGVREKKKMDRE